MTPPPYRADDRPVVADLRPVPNFPSIMDSDGELGTGRNARDRRGWHPAGMRGSLRLNPVVSPLRASTTGYRLRTLRVLAFRAFREFRSSLRMRSGELGGGWKGCGMCGGGHRRSSGRAAAWGELFARHPSPRPQTLTQYDRQFPARESGTVFPVGGNVCAAGVRSPEITGGAVPTSWLFWVAAAASTAGRFGRATWSAAACRSPRERDGISGRIASRWLRPGRR